MEGNLGMEVVEDNLGMEAVVDMAPMVVGTKGTLRMEVILDMVVVAQDILGTDNTIDPYKQGHSNMADSLTGTGVCNCLYYRRVAARSKDCPAVLVHLMKR